MSAARAPECRKDSAMTISPHDIAHVLSEALPHMQRYDEETVVVKYGGHAMGEEDMARSFARDVVLMEQTAINPVVVHGGGPQIGEMLKRLGIKSEFAGGLRITDAATIEIVEMVLAGTINKQLVAFINGAGGRAIGLCGKDGNMVFARKATRRVADPQSNTETEIDLGFVGEPERVDTMVLEQILGRDLIPVLAPLATSKEGVTYNVNADTFAGAIAGALKAKRLLLLTDVPGVLDKSKTLIKELTANEARTLIADGTISGGMIPKVETCINALEAGVEGVVILDNPLYPHHVNLWQQVDARIRDYIADFLKVAHDEAFRLQKDYYKRYGTTLRGMMIEHGMKPDDFLDYVHQIDYSPLEPDAALGAAIEKLPGRKLILTNDTTGHTAAVVARVGRGRHCDEVIHIFAGA